MTMWHIVSKMLWFQASTNTDKRSKHMHDDYIWILINMKICKYLDFIKNPSALHNLKTSVPALTVGG